MSVSLSPSFEALRIVMLLGRIVGFLFGFSLASSYAAYHLLDEYKQASAALQASVEELQASTEKVRSFNSICVLYFYRLMPHYTGVSSYSPN